MSANIHLQEDIEVRKDLFLSLYKKNFHQVAKYIAKRGGSLEDAKDLFQDALVIYYEKLCAGLEEHHHYQGAYLFGIAKILWLKKYEANAQEVPLGDLDFEPWDQDQPQTANDKILRFLEHAGKKCMDLLRSVYYDQSSMREISEKFGFSGERSATVQKYKCLEKVRDTVKEKSLTYEDFLV